jgi:hypothetical protein
LFLWHPGGGEKKKAKAAPVGLKLTPEELAELYKTIDYDASHAVSMASFPRDYVHIKVDFELHRGSATLLSSRQDDAPGGARRGRPEIARCAFTSFAIATVIRPGSSRYELSLATLDVEDLYTARTVFPMLVTRSDKGGDGADGGGPRGPLLQFSLDTLGQTRVDLTLAAVAVHHSAGVTQRLVAFLASGGANEALRSAAAERLTLLRARTLSRLRRAEVVLSADLGGPEIIMLEDPRVRDSRAIVADLGRLIITSSSSSSNNNNNSNSAAIDGRDRQSAGKSTFDDPRKVYKALHRVHRADHRVLEQAALDYREGSSGAAHQEQHARDPSAHGDSRHGPTATAAQDDAVLVARHVPLSTATLAPGTAPATEHDKYNATLSDITVLVTRYSRDWHSSAAQARAQMQVVERFSITLDAYKQVNHADCVLVGDWRLVGRVTPVVVNIDAVKFAYIERVAGQLGSGGAAASAAADAARGGPSAGTPPLSTAAGGGGGGGSHPHHPHHPAPHAPSDAATLAAAAAVATAVDTGGARIDPESRFFEGYFEIPSVVINVSKLDGDSHHHRHHHHHNLSHPGRSPGDGRLHRDHNHGRDGGSSPSSQHQHHLHHHRRRATTFDTQQQQQQQHQQAGAPSLFVLRAQRLLYRVTARQHDQRHALSLGGIRVEDRVSGGLMVWSEGDSARFGLDENRDDADRHQPRRPQHGEDDHAIPDLIFLDLMLHDRASPLYPGCDKALHAVFTSLSARADLRTVNELRAMAEMILLVAGGDAHGGAHSAAAVAARGDDDSDDRHGFGHGGSGVLPGLREGGGAGVGGVTATATDPPALVASTARSRARRPKIALRIDAKLNLLSLTLSMRPAPKAGAGMGPCTENGDEA